MQLGDIGTVITLRVRDENGDAIDLSASDVLNIKVRKPSGDLETFTAGFGGSGNGDASYTTVDGDIDEPGNYQLQCYAEIGTKKWHSTRAVIPVYPNV